MFELYLCLSRSKSLTIWGPKITTERLQPNKTLNETGGEQTLATPLMEKINKLEEMLQNLLTQQQSAQANMRKLGGLVFAINQKLSPSPTASTLPQEPGSTNSNPLSNSIS